MSNGSGGELLTVGQGGDWYFAPNTQGILSLPLIQATNARFDNIRTGGIVGAYLIDGSTGSYPIASTIDSLIDSNLTNDADDAFIVMPGYKIIVFANGIDSIPAVTFDNTEGTVPKYYNMAGTSVGVNQASSCRLYYMGVEIPRDASRV
jgi:hypothetical protein